MAHSAHSIQKIETFIRNVASMNLEELAQQHLIAGEELLEIEDTAAAKATGALIAVIDAVGHLKFPGEWQAARDNAGLNQDA